MTIHYTVRSQTVLVSCVTCAVPHQCRLKEAVSEKIKETENRNKKSTRNTVTKYKEKPERPEKPKKYKTKQRNKKTETQTDCPSCLQSCLSGCVPDIVTCCPAESALCNVAAGGRLLLYLASLQRRGIVGSTASTAVTARRAYSGHNDNHDMPWHVIVSQRDASGRHRRLCSAAQSTSAEGHRVPQGGGDRARIRTRIKTRKTTSGVTEGEKDTRRGQRRKNRTVGRAGRPMGKELRDGLMDCMSSGSRLYSAYTLLAIDGFV